MPRGDGTGPWGAGPMTGRGAGFCAGNAVPGYTSAGAGLGRFGGYGGAWRGGAFGWGGCGYRGRFWAAGPAGWQYGLRGPDPWAASDWQGVSYTFEPTREQKAALLQAQAENLERALGTVRERLAKLESEEE